MVNGISIRLSVDMTATQLANCSHETVSRLVCAAGELVKTNTSIAIAASKERKKILEQELGVTNKLLSVMIWLKDNGYDLNENNDVVHVGEVEPKPAMTNPEPEGQAVTGIE